MKKEIIKPFDLEAYKNGAKVKTRNGREVRIICTDVKNQYYPIAALVKLDDGSEASRSYTSEGKFLPYKSGITNDDLVIVEEIEESVFWSEQKYKEALNKAKDMLSNKEVRREDMEYLFPELHEDEDKVYKRAIRQMYSFLPNKPTYIGNVRVEDIFAWLAKQGSKHLDEQPCYNIGDVICDKSCTTLNKEAQPNMEIVDIKNGMYICDKGSFPVSQQDEYELVGKKIDMKPVGSVSNELREASLEHARNEMMNTTIPNNMTFEFAYNFEEGAKWQAAQKHSWSDEDEYRAEKLLGWLNTLINYIQGDATVSLDLYRERKQQVEIIKTWLKSLKALNVWKPSDEQMDALVYHLKHTNENSRLYKETKKLYDQLKKLK